MFWQFFVLDGKQNQFATLKAVIKKVAYQIHMKEEDEYIRMMSISMNSIIDYINSIIDYSNVICSYMKDIKIIFKKLLWKMD